MIDSDYLKKIRRRLEALEEDLADPTAAAQPDRYRGLLTEHAHLRKLRECGEDYLQILKGVEDNRALVSDPSLDEELRPLAEAERAELEARQAAVERELRVALIPPDPDDDRNTILEIRAGTGGDEAALFAGDLYRMYCKHAEQNQWKTSIIDVSLTPLGGYKEIVFSIEGTGVYRQMRYESGVHRVQRIPETEASGRIHTSAATVAVLPEAEAVDEIDVRADDLRVDTYRASGAGGQHVNKTDSAVRITHLPSGLVVQSQDERSQHRNKEKAMRVLRARLLDQERQAESDKMADARRTQVGSGDRSQRIRTYNFPQNRVTDHRINLTLYSLDRLLEGGLADLADPLYEQDMELKIRKQLASASAVDSGQSSEP